MISRGNARGSVILQVKSGVFWVKLIEDPSGKDLIGAFREARRRKLLAGPTPTMVDMLEFNGTIDWRAISAIRAMTPWERGHPAGQRGIGPILFRCAYVSGDPLLAPVIKIICDLFGHTRHRQFRDQAQAVLWVLQSEAPAADTVRSDD
jgi:hypothetical protein